MKRLYTTSEYLNGLELQCDGNLYALKGKEFGLFSSAAAAKYDAQWYADYCKREGIRKRKPTVYRIKLERVK